MILNDADQSEWDDQICLAIKNNIDTLIVESSNYHSTYRVYGLKLNRKHTFLRYIKTLLLKYISFNDQHIFLLLTNLKYLTNLENLGVVLSSEEQFHSLFFAALYLTRRDNQQKKLELDVNILNSRAFFCDMEKITYVAAKLCGTCNKFESDLDLASLKQHKKIFLSEIERNDVDAQLGIAYSFLEYNCLFKEIIKISNLKINGTG